MIIIAILVRLINLFYGIYIYKNKKLTLIASIEPQKIPENKINSLLKCYLYVMIFSSTLLFLTIYYMTVNLQLGMIFLIFMFLCLSIFYIYYIKISK